MNYGYFDDAAREYVITQPDTPASWSNYLGTTDYGAIITNNAGGYSFYKTAAQGRFLRLRFNSIPLDQPGRYLYLRDKDDGDYWSTSWQPAGKPLEQFRSECRHGTAYTSIESEYHGILSETTYFVPLGQEFEYWRVKLTNRSGRVRRLQAFTYCEFSSNWDTGQDLTNLQYSSFIMRTSLEEQVLRISINDHLPQDPENFTNNDQSRQCWMALAESPLTGFDSSRATFLGPYRSYHNPAVVEQGRCQSSCAYGDTACGTLQTELELQSGESREFLVLLGIGDARTVGKATLATFGTSKRAEEELQKLKKSWHTKLQSLVVQTPDPEFNSMINMWALYNSLITFNWSRSASLVYNGERNGLGFRDSVQDVLGILAAEPEAARQRLELMLTGQFSCGGAMPVVRPFDHHPGHETYSGDEHLRSDDCLWFFNAIPAYVAESGDQGFYAKVLPYADQGEATVLGHLRRALEFNLERRGKHGLPCGLEADWNDCLKLGHHGESLFVAFQLYWGLSVYADVAQHLGKTSEAAWAAHQRQDLGAAIQTIGWDGSWFIWAIGEDGTVYGTKESLEGQVYQNTQVWAVLSGAATPEQARKCLNTVKERLETPFGVMLSAPPFVKTPVEVMRAVLFNPGVKENAGIFNHTQGWSVMAECLLGNGDQAYSYYRAFMPASYNDRAEVRQVEPYVQAQTTYSTASPQAGVARTSWLSGAATWAYFSAVHSILGIRPEIGGLRLDPCIPSTWEGFQATRIWRGKRIDITVENPNAVCRGVVALALNGQALRGSLLPLEDLTDDNQVSVVLG